jgi:uncharacterized protein YbgA (DUF1722 family)/uncharacterized protein YbbK (DUF523 family)
MTTDEYRRPLLGIGSCLAGNAVRYDGDSKIPNAHVREICTHFDTRAFCPEMAIGLGTPRPPIHLVGNLHAVRVVDVATHTRDYTCQIQAYARQVLEQAPQLCGYILVQGSPSCGYGEVKRYSESGEHLASDQNGIFAQALADSDPLLPLADDDHLVEPGQRESFVNRARAYHDWKMLLQRGLTPQRLIAFYSRYKYLVMAHHHPSYKALGPMLAHAGRQSIDELASEFIGTLMAALSHHATRRSHSNVLFHLAGYLRRDATAVQRQQLSALIEDYRTGKVPLAEPLTLLKQHFAEFPNEYITAQVFLDLCTGTTQPEPVQPDAARR